MGRLRRLINQGKNMDLNPFDSNPNDLTTPTINENCHRDIKVIEVGPTK